MLDDDRLDAGAGGAARADDAADRPGPGSGPRPGALLLPALLAACGEGSGGGGAAPAASAPVPVVAAAPTATQASRFLGQATMGATKQAVADVSAQGYDGWLTAQFAMARTTTHWDWLVANGYAVAANLNTTNGFDATVWRGMIADPDQLRQRVGAALLDMLAVGIGGVNTSWRAFAMASYLDVLLDGAFGNYRQLMDAITYNVATASFLTYLGNRKANAATGAQPDENYARELMQLFTLGLYQLNTDGSAKTGANGAPLETYTQADVSGLARVFTGLTITGSDNSTPDRLRQPLTVTASINETGSATFLGTTVTGGGTAAIKGALDAIFAHPNIAPFVGRQLIQRLVTSNPSPGYVARVAGAFADDGHGVRGNLTAVVRAVLLDSEARSDAGLAAANAGKLREPVLRLTGWARAFNATSPSAAWAIGDTSSTTTRLAQSMGRSPSVFNWFRPGYTPPDTAIATAGLVAPEFQLTDEQTVIAYVNYMSGLVQNGAGDVKADYTDMLALAGDSGALVDQANLLLAAGQLPAAGVAAIRAAVDSIAAASPTNRVWTAVLLTLASPDYLTVR